MIDALLLLYLDALGSQLDSLLLKSVGHSGRPDWILVDRRQSWKLASIMCRPYFVLIIMQRDIHTLKDLSLQRKYLFSLPLLMFHWLSWLMELSHIWNFNDVIVTAFWSWLAQTPPKLHHVFLLRFWSWRHLLRYLIGGGVLRNYFTLGHLQVDIFLNFAVCCDVHKRLFMLLLPLKWNLLQAQGKLLPIVPLTCWWRPLLLQLF